MINLNDSAGIVTLTHWTMMPDGGRYMYVWSPSWKILTDKQIPVDGFRSTEHWQLAAVLGDEIIAFIPGCQVKGWAKTNKAPKGPGVDCYCVGEEE